MTVITREELEASDGSSIIGFIQAGTGAAARTVEEKLRADLPFSPLDFGAAGDKATDDTAALAAMAACLNGLCDDLSDATAIGYYPRLVFPACEGFRTTATLELNGAIEIVMHAPLWVEAAADEAIVGLHIKDFSGEFSNSPRDRAPVLDVRRLTQSDWSSEDDVGVLIDALYASSPTIKRTDGFCVGFDVCLGYGRFSPGDHRQNKLCTIRARGTPDIEQFSNQLAIRGGSFANDGANRGMSRYGLLIKGVAPFGLNTVSIGGTSFELALAAAIDEGGLNENLEAEAIPIVLDGSDAAIVSVRIFDVRSETNGGTLIRAIGEVSDVDVELLDGELEYSYPTSLLIDDQSDLGGIKVARRHGANSAIWRPFFQSGPLAQKAVQLTGSTIAVQNLECATNAGAAPATQTFTYGDYGPSFDADGYMSNSGPLYGVRVRLNGERALALTGTKKVDSAMVVYALCFDSAGAQITDAGAVYSNSARGPATLNTGIYGGLYAASIYPQNDATVFDGVLSFSADVATVFIAIGSPCAGFSLASLDGKAEWFSCTSHLKDSFVGDAVPIGLANVTYAKGSRVYDIAPSSGGVEGWLLTTQPTAGSAGTWKAFGTVA
jgi:hypothetical protein